VRLALTDVRIVGFQRAAVAAYALPADEREAAFARLARLEGIRDERGERIRRFDGDIARASMYAAIAALAETVVIPHERQRFSVASASVEPVSAHDLTTELVAPEASRTVPDSAVPGVDGDAVVVWCGNENVRIAVSIVHGLVDAGFPVIVVANGRIPGAEDHAAFVPLSEGLAALRRARVVIPAHPADPADAIAFARLGFRLAVPSSSGSTQYLQGVAVFRTWIERDMRRAVLAAIAAPPPRLGVLPSTLPDFPPLPVRGPRVVLRIVVDLGAPLAPQTAQAVAVQTYADIVRTIDGAIYELTVPNGAVLFPDAVARLVDAAERSQAVRVFGPALRAASGGAYDIEGDAFALLRIGGGRATLARVAVACGVVTA